VDALPEIHKLAAQGFARNAATYVGARPEYPQEVESWLLDDLGLCPGKAALDLGAATGKFLPRLRATGATLVVLRSIGYGKKLGPSIVRKGRPSSWFSATRSCPAVIGNILLFLFQRRVQQCVDLAFEIRATVVLKVH